MASLSNKERLDWLAPSFVGAFLILTALKFIFLNPGQYSDLNSVSLLLISLCLPLIMFLSSDKFSSTAILLLIVFISTSIYFKKYMLFLIAAAVVSACLFLLHFIIKKRPWKIVPAILALSGMFSAMCLLIMGYNDFLYICNGCVLAGLSVYFFMNRGNGTKEYKQVDTKVFIVIVPVFSIFLTHFRVEAFLLYAIMTGSLIIGLVKRNAETT